VPDARLREDLKADNLAMIALVIATEEAFNVEIPASVENTPRTVGDLLTYVNARAKKGCR
jgi:acyl carrier protein